MTQEWYKGGTEKRTERIRRVFNHAQDGFRVELLPFARLLSEPTAKPNTPPAAAALPPPPPPPPAAAAG